MCQNGQIECEKLKLNFALIQDFIQGLIDTEKSVVPEDVYKEIDMKGITRRKDGRWQIQLQRDGVRKIEYASTFEKARLKLAKLKKVKIFKQKEEVKKLEKKITVGEWYEKWLKEYKKGFITEKSYKLIIEDLKKIMPKLKNIALVDLTTSKIQLELNKLEHNRVKERTCTYLNALLQKACDINLIDRNPFRAVVKEKKNVYKSSGYNFDEQCLIVENMSKYGIEHEIMLYLMCGCRPKELPNKTQFDFKNNIINIYGTKNENAKHREIEMSIGFAEYIKKYFEKNDTKPFEFVKQQFKKLCVENNIENPKLYRLRHTFATNHFTLGTNVKYVQHWLGHYGVQLTLDTYTDIDKKSSKEKIKKLYNNFYYEI